LGKLEDLMALERWIAPLHGVGAKVKAALPGMALLLAIALILAACEYPGIPHPLAAQVEKPASSTSQPTSTPSPSQNPDTGAKEPEPLQERVHIGLKDFRLDPDNVKGKSGTVTFVLKNEGRYTHDFRVEGQRIDEKAPKVGRGRTFEWQIALQPGTYRISCPISNHADRGMNGTMEVVP
jgi:plastocyanin